MSKISSLVSCCKRSIYIQKSPQGVIPIWRASFRSPLHRDRAEVETAERIGGPTNVQIVSETALTGFFERFYLDC
jgi:hypothetical protein